MCATRLGDLHGARKGGGCTVSPPHKLQVQHQLQVVLHVNLPHHTLRLPLPLPAWCSPPLPLPPPPAPAPLPHSPRTAARGAIHTTGGDGHQQRRAVHGRRWAHPAGRRADGHDIGVVGLPFLLAAPLAPPAGPAAARSAPGAGRREDEGRGRGGLAPRRRPAGAGQACRMRVALKSAIWQ